MLRELEVVAGLIERKRQGLGKPNLIYVKNFLSVGQNGRFLNRKMDDSGVIETQILESAEVRGSNTEINNTEDEAEKASKGGDHGNGRDENGRFAPKYQNVTLGEVSDVSQRIADDNGISRMTVFRAEQFAQGVDSAEEAVPGAREEILSGRVNALTISVETTHNNGKAFSKMQTTPRIGFWLDNSNQTPQQTAENILNARKPV